MANTARFAETTCCVWPDWTQRVVPQQPLDGNIELDWLGQALEGESIFALWEGEQGLVAPLSYRRHKALEQAMHKSAERGWPVRLRRSGGGVVPQCKGILNVSLAFPCEASPGDIAETLYLDFCDSLASPLQAKGVETDAVAVSGSFCDGRFNLAAYESNHDTPKKVAGTAQYWRRHQGRQAVLLHALVMVDADPAALTDVANCFEHDLNSGSQYSSTALTNISTLLGHERSHETRQSPITQMLADALFESFSNT